MAIFFESLLVEILVGSVTLFIILYLRFTRNFNYWKKKGIPYVEPVPFFGNIKDVVLGRVSTGFQLKKIYDDHQNEKFIGVFQLQKPTLLLRDPEIIKDALVKNFTSFHDRGMPVDEEKRPLSAHLFSLAGPRWRALRAKLTPTFTSGKMKMMYQLMYDCSEELRLHLKDKAARQEELEMRETMAQFTTDIIGSCAFGLQMNSMKNPDSEFRRMGRKVFESTFLNSLRRIISIFVPGFADLFTFLFKDGEVEDFFLRVVKETVEYREKNNITRNDFMQLLIKLKHKENIDDEHSNVGDQEKDDINMTDYLLAAQVFIFFLAGFETSSTLTSFALYELALNPEIQRRLQEEVDETLKENNGKLTYDVVLKMEYLDKVASESLRKYPPLGDLVRLCTAPYTIPGTDIEIETGTLLSIPVYGLHHDPKYYPRPEKFDPERFSEESKATRHHFVYLPFGEGPRNCIGMRFGLLQAKLGLATLMRDFHFSPSEHTDIPLQLSPTSAVTAAKNGIHVKISCRH